MKALRVDPSGVIGVVEVAPDSLKDHYRLIGGGCDCAEPVRLPDDVTMWLDEDGISRKLPVNHFVTRIMRGLDLTPMQPFVGTAVFTGDKGGLTNETITKLVDYADAGRHHNPLPGE
jgi:hypothetical protein